MNIERAVGGGFADVAAKAEVNRYLLSTLAALAQGGTGPGRPSPQDLAEELRRRGADEQVLAEHLARLTPRADGEDSAQPFLVFDQFEELLTLDPTDEEAKRGFLRPLGAVLRDRDRWALFAMREDYVPSLDPYLPLLPDRLSATFRLDLLGTRAASTAIREPAREMGVTFEESVVEQIVEQLSLTRVLNPVDGSTQEKPGAFVEPVYLQVVCQMLWEQRQLPDRITARDLTAFRVDGVEGGDGVTAALQVYYDRTVERVTRESPGKGLTEVSERAIRNWFERTLISEGDLRLPMLLGEEKKYGLEPGLLLDLANAYLIRSDRRSGGVWYELAHDRLVAPIRKSNRAWRRAQLSPFQQSAEVWNESGRKADLLVGGEVLAEGERLRGGHAGLWSRTDEEFLDACRAERDYKAVEAAHSRKQARLRWWITWISVGGLILVLGLAVWAEVQRRKAQDARKEIEKTLVAGLWRPIGRQDGPLDATEVSALSELGSLPKEYDGARLKFVEKALANHANCQRFARRAPVVLQALVGLNGDLAEGVRGVVRPRLADETAGSEVRAAAARAVAALPPGDLATAAAAASVLLAEMNNAALGEERHDLTGALVELSEGLPEEQKADLLNQAATLLLDALDQEKDAQDRGWLAAALGKVTMGLSQAQNTDLLGKAATRLLDALHKEKDSYARSWLATALGEVVKGLPATLLLDALDKEKKADARFPLASALGEVAKGLPQAQKDDLLGKAATLLLDALDKETDAHARERLDWALAEVAKGLPAQRLLDALAKEKDANARFRLAAALGEVAKGLPQAQKDDLLDQATTLLLDALDKETDAHARERLAAALREVVKGLPADKAAKVLLETLDKEKNRDAQCWLASALAEVAERLPQARKADLRHQAAKFVILSRDIPKNAKIREGLAEDLAKGATEAGVPKGTILLFQALAQQPALEEQNLAALEHMATQMEMPVAVDLLKQPLCYGKARQILLRRVEQLTGQTFPSRWDMVDYLRRHRPDIDLDTPPQRPDE